LASDFVTSRVTLACAYRMKNYSVYVGITGYLAMLIAGSVALGALSKLLAEVLRIPYYLHTDAKDMAGLSVFFIVASIVALCLFLL